MAQWVKNPAVVTAVARVQSLAPELLHAEGSAKKKKKFIILQLAFIDPTVSLGDISMLM